MNRYLAFLGWATAAGALAAAAGYLPTRALGGAGAVRAMLAGCLVSWLASAAGGVAVAAGGEAAGGRRLKVALLALCVRLLAVAALGASAVAAGIFERRPLLLWIALSYLVLLVPDAWYAAAGGRPARGRAAPRGAQGGL